MCPDIVEKLQDGKDQGHKRVYSNQVREAPHVRTVIVLEDSSLASLGGGQRVTLDVLEALRPHFSLFLLDYARQSRFLNAARPLVSGVEHIHGTRLVPRKERRSFLGMAKALWSLKADAQAVIRVLEAQKVSDVITYATTTKTLAVAYILSWLKGIPYVFHAHLVLSRLTPIRWILVPALRRALCVICVSKTVEKSMTGRCQLVPNGVQIESRQPRNLNANRIVVASFSSLEKFKGIEYFMSSYRFLRHPDRVEYRVYGEGTERPSLEHLEREHVRLMGATEDVRTVLADVTLVVAPSLANEAFGMNVLESLAAGIPVIASDKGGLAELLKDGKVGFRVRPRDPEAIAERIDYLIDHPEVYKVFSANALEYAKQFDVQRYKQTVRDIFKSL